MDNTAKVIAYIPQGFSDNQKSAYLDGIKRALFQAFGTPLNQSRVYIVEANKEDACFYWNDSISNNLFMPFGMNDDQKEQYAIWYKKAVDEAFGADSLPAFVTIDEHSLECEYLEGKMLSQK